MNNTRKATKDDLLEIANIHKSQFPDHYLGQFSEKLLAKFYACFLIDDIIFLVSDNDNKLSGFVLGGELDLINNKSREFIKKNITYYPFEILLRPKTWKKSLVKLYKLLSKKSAPVNTLDSTEKFTLLSIAVSKKAQGSGIAKNLIIDFDKEMSKMSDRYFLSVSAHNSRAIKFYEIMNFKKANSYNDEIQYLKYL